MACGAFAFFFFSFSYFSFSFFFASVGATLFPEKGGLVFQRRQERVWGLNQREGALSKKGQRERHAHRKREGEKEKEEKEQ